MKVQEALNNMLAVSRQSFAECPEITDEMLEGVAKILCAAGGSPEGAVRLAHILTLEPLRCTEIMKLAYIGHLLLHADRLQDVEILDKESAPEEEEPL